MQSMPTKWCARQRRLLPSPVFLSLTVYAAGAVQWIIRLLSAVGFFAAGAASEVYLTLAALAH